MELTNNSAQTVAAGANVLFIETPICGNQSIIHRPGSGLVTLRGICPTQGRARFRVTYSSNLLGTGTISSETLLSLGIALNGEVINSTIRTITVADTVATSNVAATTLIDIPAGCCGTLSIKNNSTIAVSAVNADLIVERVA